MYESIYVLAMYILAQGSTNNMGLPGHEYNNNYNSYPIIIAYDYSLLRLNVYHYSFLHSTHIIIVIRIFTDNNHYNIRS